ncbi:MAG: hypothetical protein SGI99_01725 [Pseudomonadota bacterium]|nr:hypothetical protein [Pseudomonadota bacterium]
MPSSTSSSERASSPPSIAQPAQVESQRHGASAAPGLRLTASDRPGVAQPVPERDIPARPWGGIALGALLLALLLLGVWESHWRAFGSVPGYRNSDGHWAEQRRRIDSGEGGKTVIIGSSRVLFNVQLPVWQRITGTAPIQLALEGTSPTSFLEDLANDPDFHGRLLIGVTPALFFSGREVRGDVIPYYRNQGPSQRSGHWLSQRLLEPFFAFDDPDFALAAVVERQAWPPRPGLREFPPVRKLSVQGAQRNTRMWQKVETDPGYQAMVQNVWMSRLARPPPHMDTPAKMQVMADAQIARAVVAVAKLRARGIAVLFIRAPSIGPLNQAEERDLPRALTWDLLLQRTGARGIHFMDYTELQGFTQPEWSHLSAEEADRFTAALVPIAEREFAAQEN